MIKAFPFAGKRLFHTQNSRTRPANRRDRKACGSHDKDSGERSKP
nr:MAG TPA: hypothetical protein [Caudoviricetes sp.]